MHAADSIAGAVRAGDASGMVRRLQPFVDNPSVTAITVTGTAGRPLFDYRRGEARPAGALSSEARAPVRTYVENIPGAATPATLANLTLVLEQAAPVAAVSVGGRLEAANAARLRFTWLLSLVLAALGAGIAGVLAWRAVSQLQRPVASLIKSADRIGQGDYTRPVEVQRRDALGELEQALERMRGRLRHSTINKAVAQRPQQHDRRGVRHLPGQGDRSRTRQPASCWATAEVLNKTILAVLDERERAEFDMLQAAQETRRPSYAPAAGRRSRCP